MSSGLRRHLSPANVLSTAALFIALGGGAYAAGLLPANSVGTKQLRTGAVTSTKLGRGAVDSSKVKHGSLLRSDFRAGAIAVGPVGQQGAPGAKGATGPATQPAVNYSSATVVVPDGAQTATAGSVACPAGMNVLGGGATFASTSGVEVLDSYPDARTGWKADAVNASGTGDKTMTVYAECAQASTTTP